MRKKEKVGVISIITIKPASVWKTTKNQWLEASFEKILPDDYIIQITSYVGKQTLPPTTYILSMS